MPFSPMDQNDRAVVEKRYVNCVYTITVKGYFIPDCGWMAMNVKGRWYGDSRKFMFELEKDAVMFALKYA